VVSIPRSEFWSFGLGAAGDYTPNSIKFQFLGRNSGRSDAAPHPANLPVVHVSIPRSEFWSFGLVRCLTIAREVRGVSIPRSEFWSFGHDTRTSPSPVSISFNSSVGILVVRTHAVRVFAPYRRRGFNSSVGILVVRTITVLTIRYIALAVSIPRSEFWSFGRSGRHVVHQCIPSFNSSVGILVVRTSLSDRRGHRIREVSIPRSEFWSFGLSCLSRKATKS